VVALVGCQSDEPPTTPAEPGVPAEAADAALSEVVPADAAQPAAPSTDDVSEVTAPAEEFVPPFPNRVDMFVPPRRTKVAVRGDGADGDTIELKGFITAPGNDSPWVMLSINGTESPIAIGQEKMGVRVISVDQPKVVLQRGRSRWTESLE
jgi:hypothetical protein